MKPIHPFIYNELKTSHESSLIKLTDIKHIYIKNIEKTEGLINLPIEVHLTNGKKIRHIIVRTSLARLGDSKGTIFVDNLDVKQFDKSVDKNTQREYLKSLLSSVNIEELDLTEIEVVVTDNSTILLRALSGSILYCGTVLVKQAK